jgi:hypothetical protein
MGQYRQVLLYGAPHPDRFEFWKANPHAHEDPVSEALYDICHSRYRKRGDITTTEPDHKPYLIGVCLTSAYDDTTLEVTPEIVDDAIRTEWANVVATAQELGVSLDAPSVWLCIVEVA